MFSSGAPGGVNMDEASRRSRVYRCSVIRISWVNIRSEGRMISLSDNIPHSCYSDAGAISTSRIRMVPDRPPLSTAKNSIIRNCIPVVVE